VVSLVLSAMAYSVWPARKSVMKLIVFLVDHGFAAPSADELASSEGPLGEAKEMAAVTVMSPWPAPVSTTRSASTPLSLRAVNRFSVWLGETRGSALPCRRRNGGVEEEMWVAGSAAAIWPL
jgi:hypothetical protein